MRRKIRKIIAPRVTTYRHEWASEEEMAEGRGGGIYGFS